MNIRINLDRWGLRWIGKLITNRVPVEVWGDLKSRAQVTGTARREWYKGRAVSVTLEQREPDAVSKETI